MAEFGVVDTTSPEVLLINALSLAIDYHVNREGTPSDVVDTAMCFHKFLLGEEE